MSATLAKSGHFDPIHAAHAIEQVVFVIQFDSTLDEAQLSEVRKVAMQFKSDKDLPGQMEVQEFSIAFSPPGSEPPEPPPLVPPGLVLQSIGRDGTVENDLRVERATLTFRTALYSRWDSAWAQARRYFESIVPAYTQYSRIRAISLNYVDKFVWAGDVAECNPSLLISTHSRYVCPHVFETREFWHSHTGKFIRTDDYTKRLLNVNIDYLEEASVVDTRRVVSITTVVTDMLNQPGYSSVGVTKEDSLDFVEKRMQNLHAFGKDILGDIISTEMSKRIALIG